MRKSLGPLIAVFGIASLALSAGMGIAHAQMDPQAPPMPGEPTMQPPMPMGPPMRAPMGMSMQPTMISDGDLLYILIGTHLMKVDKSSMKVVAQTDLPMQPMNAGPQRMQRQRIEGGGGQTGGRMP